MKNNDDFDFIKNKFENDNIVAPDSLGENSVAERLEGKGPAKIKLYKRRGFKAFVSAAACVAVVLCSITAFNYGSNSNAAQNDENAPGNLLSFESYSDIQKAAKKSAEKDYYDISLFDAYSYKAEATADTANESTAAGMGGGSNSETYVQVEGVDEADIIKTDSRYIYFAAGRDNTVKIYDSKTDKIVSCIDDFKIEEAASKNFVDSYIDYDNSIYEMYLTDGKLIINTTSTDSTFVKSENTIEETHSYVYDISDVENPKRLSAFTQSGRYVSSRMIGDMLYVVSSKYLYYDMCKELDDCIPYTSYGDEKNMIKAQDVYYCPNSDDSSYIVISAVDISSKKKSTETKAIFGAAGEVYCSMDNLYITVSKYENAGENTEIIKASLNDGKIILESSATVSGYIDDQFSMDEYGGYFRVAVTTQTADGKDINKLFVFDGNMKKVGEVKGFAKNESIKAVKFLGDTAYVITYEQTDPLFVIDLSNPQNPEILGSVKIDGFSSQLLTLENDRILGIGYNTSETEYGVIQDGIKLVLFDVSDKANPAVLDTYVLKNAYSEAQYNHKAIVINKEKGYFAIDYSQYISSETGEDEEHNGALTFEVKDDKINVTHNFDCSQNNSAEEDSPVYRCAYIDDTVYVVSCLGNFYSFNY
ncbi:MAG: beta-propeller domain-containing protein [Eubacterium sp.]